MGDYGYFSYPHVGVNVPNTCPFFPNIRTDEQGITHIRFNQSYVFDWQTKKSGYKELSAIKISGIDQTFQIPADELKDTRFFVKITTSQSKATIVSASIEKKYDEDVLEEEGDNFHYSPDYPEDGYKNKSGEFWIPICNFNKDGVLKDLFLRENIHWQKINFANLPKSGGTSFGVLKNWGEESEFNNNPNVIFQNLVQKGGEFFIQLEQGGGGIVITTQLPELTEDKTSLLYRSSTNEWQWIERGLDDETAILYKKRGAEAGWENLYEGVPYVKADDLQFEPFPAGASESTPYFLGYNGAKLEWYASEECIETNSQPSS
jgi:hypothetical protein